MLNSIFTKNNIFSLDITNNNEFLNYLQKNSNYIYKYNQCIKYALSVFQILNIPPKMLSSESFIKSSLILNGGVVFTDKTSTGLNAYNFIANDFNEWGEPTKITLKTFNKLSNKVINDNNDFIIVYLDDTKQGLSSLFEQISYSYALLTQGMYNNIIAKSLQGFLQAHSEQSEQLKGLEDLIFNQNGFIKIDIDKGIRADELLKITSPELDFSALQMWELRNKIENDLFTAIGLNHLPYEKKERLITDEIKTNDYITDIVRNGFIDSINAGLEKVNKKYGTNMICTEKAGYKNDIKE